MIKYAKLVNNLGNKREVLEYCKKAIDFGDTNAMLEYGRMVIGNGTSIIDKKDMTKVAADQYLNVVKNDKNRYVMRKYADMLYNNDGLEEPVEKNKTEALKLYKKLIDLGDIYLLIFQKN